MFHDNGGDVLSVLRACGVKARRVQTSVSVHAVFFDTRRVFGAFRIFVFHVEKSCVRACVYDRGACHGVRPFRAVSHQGLEDGG